MESSTFFSAEKHIVFCLVSPYNTSSCIYWWNKDS